jgi:hypothetical protein
MPFAREAILVLARLDGFAPGSTLGLPLSGTEAVADGSEQTGDDGSTAGKVTGTDIGLATGTGEVAMGIDP